MAVENDFMTVADAAALLGVHIQTLRKLARQKKVPAFKVGRDWRFRKEALVRWADEQGHEQKGGVHCPVLVIDDEEKVRQTLSRMLARFGCLARQATGGVEGLKRVAEEVPRLILLDLQMPDMNGPQFLAELRKTHPHLPVVIVTGYPDSELMREAAGHAPVMLLAKPVDPALLERTVRTVMGDELAMGSTG